jgi:hypothetical protein
MSDICSTATETMNHRAEPCGYSRRHKSSRLPVLQRVYPWGIVMLLPHGVRHHRCIISEFRWLPSFHIVAMPRLVTPAPDSASPLSPTCDAATLSSPAKQTLKPPPIHPLRRRAFTNQNPGSEPSWPASPASSSSQVNIDLPPVSQSLSPPAARSNESLACYEVVKEDELSEDALRKLYEDEEIDRFLKLFSAVSICRWCCLRAIIMNASSMSTKFDYRIQPLLRQSRHLQVLSHWTRMQAQVAFHSLPKML